MKSILFFLMLILVLASCGGEPAKKPTRKEVEPPVNVPDKASVAPSADKPVKKDAESKESHDAKPNPAIEGKLCDMILEMPEIQKMDNSIRRKSGGKRGLKTYISNRPSDDEEYYTVSVAEDNGSALATYYIFHIYPDNTIMYYDVVNDGEMSLKEWRKTL